jgi:hypothetical protein
MSGSVIPSGDKKAYRSNLGKLTLTSFESSSVIPSGDKKVILKTGLPDSPEEESSVIPSGDKKAPKHLGCWGNRFESSVIPSGDKKDSRSSWSASYYWTVKGSVIPSGDKKVSLLTVNRLLAMSLVR